ncbi:MAG: flippase [Cellulophaga sp.]
MIEKLKTLKNNTGFIKYLKNTSWLFGGRILQIFSSLVVGVWVARYLGPDNYGILSYALSFVGIFSAFSTLGINQILIRELVKTPDEKSKLLGTSFILQTFGSVILMILLIIGLSLSYNDSYTNKIIIILGTATFFQSFKVIDLYFQSAVRSKIVVIAGSFGLIISALLKITMILLDAPLIAFVLVILSDSIINALLLIIFYLKNKQSIKKWQFSKIKAKELLKDSWPLILSGIVVSVYMKIDQIMLKEMLDNNAVGQYAAAVRLSEAWYFIPTAICASLFPAIVNAKKKSEKLYYSRIQKLYDLMVYISVFIAIPMTFLSYWVVNLLYGSEFNMAGEVLKIHIWAGIFVFLGVSRGGWIINDNLQRFTAMYLGVGMLANIALNFIMIPKLGIVGAAYATLISQAISVLFAPLLFKKTRISFFMMIKSLLFLNLLDILRKNKHE